jgi:hypothetical protein
MIRIETTLTNVRYDIDTIGQEIYRLIKTYIPGLYGGSYGFRSIGQYDPTFPAVFVEPQAENAQMDTTAKYHDFIDYMLYFYVIDNDASNTLTLMTSIGSSITKLFSNNALNDLSTAYTNKYKSHAGYWVNCEMGKFEISAYFKNPVGSRSEKYMRAAKMSLQTENLIVK